MASIFVALTQWQFEQSTAVQPRAHSETETPVELTEHFEPSAAMLADQEDQIVYFSATVDPERTVQVESRAHNGQVGLWLVSSATVAGAPGDHNIPIAWGWIPDEIEADPGQIQELFEESTGVAMDEPMQIQGRLLSAEGPTPNTNHFTQPVRTQMVASAQLVNLWDQPLYAGYVAAETFTVDGTEHTVAGPNIEGIAVAPQPEDQEVAWLNIFYAVEWFLFAVFSLYLWWRFVRDDYLKDQRDEELDALWERHWRSRELQRRRQAARDEKVAAQQAYRAYYGREPQDEERHTKP